jgi:hypothetical protein
MTQRSSSIDAPYGSGSFGSLRFKGTIAADTRPLTTANVLDMAPEREAASLPTSRQAVASASSDPRT